MKPEQKKNWDEMMDAWDDEGVSCQLYYAKGYTSKYANDIYGWIVYADALATLARYKEARAALQKAKLVCPKDKLHILYHQIGHLYKKKGDYPRSEKWYKRAVKEVASTEYLIFIGACLARQSKFVEAKKYYRKAIKVASDIPDEAYYNLGLILRAEEKYEEALECFEKAIELDPEYTLAKEERQDVMKVLKLKKANKAN